MNKSFAGIVTACLKHSQAYRDEISRFQQSQFFQPTELEKYQLKQFRSILHYCNQYIPFYREALQRAGKQPEDFVAIEDLQRLPIIDKRIVKENFDMFIPEKLPLVRSGAQTSGTTGCPAFFYRDMQSVIHENAAIDRFRHGFASEIYRTAVFRGDNYFEPMKEKNIYWKVFAFSHECIFLTGELGPLTIGFYDRKLRDYKPDAFYAYPSVVYQMACLYQESEMEAYHPKIILTSSEILKPMHRELIERVFNCPVRDWYGQVERVAAIGQCKEGTYHIIEDYSLVELMKTESGVEVIGSGLKNHVMPLLRYRTNDFVHLSDESCGCGSHFRIVESILGRKMSYITMPDGRKVSFFPIREIIDVKDHVIEIQFVQEKPGFLTLNIIPDKQYDRHHEEDIIRKIKKHTSEKMVVNIKIVKSIQKGSNGKMIDFISTVY